MKTLTKKILSIFLICCMAFLCFGCTGMNSEENQELEEEAKEDFEDPDFTEDEDEDEDSIEFYGTKVLYRPDSYDFNGGSGGSEGNENDYYAQYAYQIMNSLFYIFAVPNQSYLVDYAPQFTNDKEEFLPFLYDSVRYKMDTYGNVTKLKTIKNGEVKEEDFKSINEKLNTNYVEYLIVGANTSAHWNWTFDYTIEGNTSLDAYLNNSNNSYIYNEFGYNYAPKTTVPLTNNTTNRIYNIYYNDAYDNIEFFTNSQTNYYNTTFQNKYRSYFVSKGNSATDYGAYSEFTKALEYVIYSYAIDLEPAEISVSFENVSPVYDGYDYPYVINVAEYPANPAEGKSSVDVALESAKELFNKLGSYVGLVDRQINKIKNWIVENVIGPNASSSDLISYYPNVTEVRTYTDENNYTVTYEFGTPSSNKEDVRMYDETVSNIVDGVCSKVTIGSDDDGSLNIDERFLASEIKEYSRDAFMIADDSNFPKYEKGQSKFAIQPLEYQSVTLMIKGTQYIENIYVALKYDADNSGTNEGEYGNEYIDIQVDLNYYNHLNNTYTTITSEKARIYDGPYDIDYVPGLGEIAGANSIAPEGHSSGVAFESIGDYVKNNKYGSLIRVSDFNVDIGGGILKTDVGKAGYTNLIRVSNSPLVLTGSTEFRKWYTILEPTEDDPLIDKNNTYITGRLNYNLFAGQDGCDYIELTYKVLKKPGDKDKNYKFYTGLVLVDNTTTEPKDF